MAGYGDGTFGSKLNFETQITNGRCPQCYEISIFVSITPEVFRCTTCGNDLKQYVNGKISYLPMMTSNKNEDIKRDGQKG